MRFPDDCGVTRAKLDVLRSQLEKAQIDLRLVEEKAVKGSGRGGQKVNKTSSAVQLSYPPLELRVRCQKTRSRAMNRFFALRQLVAAAERRERAAAARIAPTSPPEPEA